MRKNYKKLTAVALTVAMTMGSALTAFAATSGDVSGGIDSNGKYEGGEIPYPAISVTLPTVPANSIDYIADPNDLIKSTMNASGDAINTDYAKSEFLSTTGIYFKTTDVSGDVKAQYTEKSRPMVITNENAQNLKVTVKVSQTKAASGDAIAYVSGDTFASGDTAKKLYLAVTDGTTTKALDSSGNASFTTEVKGKADNFDPAYDSTNKKYSYNKKANASGWATASYQLTGAINKNAKWQDKIEFPNVKITWSWEEGAVEKEAAPSIAKTTYKMTAGQPVEVVTDFGKGSLAAKAINSVTFNGTPWVVGKHYSVAGNKITITSATVDYLLGQSAASSTAKVIFDNNKEVSITLTK